MLAAPAVPSRLVCRSAGLVQTFFTSTMATNDTRLLPMELILRPPCKCRRNNAPGIWRLHPEGRCPHARNLVCYRCGIGASVLMPMNWFCVSTLFLDVSFDGV